MISYVVGPAGPTGAVVPQCYLSVAHPILSIQATRFYQNAQIKKYKFSPIITSNFLSVKLSRGISLGLAT